MGQTTFLLFHSIRATVACVTITLPERKYKREISPIFFSFRDGGCDAGSSELEKQGMLCR